MRQQNLVTPAFVCSSLERLAPRLSRRGFGTTCRAYLYPANLDVVATQDTCGVGCFAGNLRRAFLKTVIDHHNVQRLVEILDAYKSNNPEKSARYRDDYKVIRSWVIRRYREEQDSAGPHRRAGPGVMTHANPFIDKLAEMAVEE